MTENSGLRLRALSSNSVQSPKVPSKSEQDNAIVAPTFWVTLLQTRTSWKGSWECIWDLLCNRVTQGRLCFFLHSPTCEGVWAAASHCRLHRTIGHLSQMWLRRPRVPCSLLVCTGHKCFLMSRWALLPLGKTQRVMSLSCGRRQLYRHAISLTLFHFLVSLIFPHFFK